MGSLLVLGGAALLLGVFLLAVVILAWDEWLIENIGEAFERGRMRAREKSRD